MSTTYTPIYGITELGCGFNAITGNALPGSQTLNFTYPSPETTQYQGSTGGGGWNYNPNPNVSQNLSIPYDVVVDSNNSSGTGKSTTAQSVSQIANFISEDFGLTVHYGEYSGSLEVNFAKSTKTSDSSYYALSSGLGTFYSLTLPEAILPPGGGPTTLSGNTTWNPAFQNAVQDLPSSFSPSDPTFVQFFANWGTHVVQSVTEGYRFRLTVAVERSSNLDTTTASVAVALQVNCIVEGTATSLTNYQSQSQNYSTNSTTLVTTYGGDSTMASSLMAAGQNVTDPTTANGAFSNWLATTYTSPGGVSYTLLNIWIAASAAGASAAQVSALQSAYFYYMMQTSAIPVYSYTFVAPGVADPAIFYTTWEHSETMGGRGAWTPNGVAFYALPQDSPYLSTAPVPPGYPAWPAPVNSLQRYYASSGVYQAWAYTMDIAQDPFINQYYSLNQGDFINVIGNVAACQQSPVGEQVYGGIPVYNYSWTAAPGGNVNGYGYTLNPSEVPTGATVLYNGKPQFYAFQTATANWLPSNSVNAVAAAAVAKAKAGAK